VQTLYHEQNKFTYQVVWSPRLRYFVFRYQKTCCCCCGKQILVYFT